MKKYAIILILSLTLISCKTKKSQVSGYENATYNTSDGKIQDCPDEQIINAMPTMDGKQRVSNQYYIYKGLRKEINEFDSTWVKKHCKVKVTTVY
jgi:hypothetical protein